MRNQQGTDRCRVIENGLQFDCRFDGRASDGRTKAATGTAVSRTIKLYVNCICEFD